MIDTQIRIELKAKAEAIRRDHLETVRHQVAIAGRVTDGQTAHWLGAALSDHGRARRVHDLAEHACTPVRAGVGEPDRAYQALTAIDGHFHFLDLPDGQYTLTASLPGYGSRYGTPRRRSL